MPIAPVRPAPRRICTASRVRRDRASDVGISVDSAVDVAKDAADIILLRQDLGVLEHGVTEGRRAFANIMKYIMMAMSSNFGNMFSMAGAS